MGRQLILYVLIWCLCLSTIPSIIKPVQASSTFGNEDIGSTNYGVGADKNRACRFELTDDNVNVTEISARLFILNSPLPVDARLAIYNDTGGAGGAPDPDALMGNTSVVQVITTTEKWYNFSAGSGILLDSGYYWLAILANMSVAGTRVIQIKGDTDDALYMNKTKQTDDEFDDGFADPFPTVVLSRNWTLSIFATYDIITAGLEETFTVFQTLHIYDSLFQHLGLQRISFEHVTFSGSVNSGNEWGHLLANMFHILSSSTVSKELRYQLSSILHFPGSTATTLEGVALDLTFILSNVFSIFSSVVTTLETSAVTYTVNDALLFAGLAFILALCAIALLLLRH